MRGSFERPRAHRGRFGGCADEFFVRSTARVTEDSPKDPCINRE